MGAEVGRVQVNPDGRDHRTSVPRQEVLGGIGIEDTVEVLKIILIVFLLGLVGSA